MERLDNFVSWGQEGWNHFFSQKGSQWRNKDYKYLDNIFPLSSLKGSLLDVGCGLGDGLIYIRTKGPMVDRFAGTDFSSEAIESCRCTPALKGMSFFQHDILKPFPEKYDNIICLQTLEHLEAPLEAMRNLIDATQNLLIVGVPYRNRRPDRNHLWSFDENDFADIVDSYCVDEKQKNIYWLLDKQKRGFGFRKRRLRILPEFVQKLFKSF